MSNPQISIIIPLYNREELIKETLNSIIIQSYMNWEAIIVDDNSTDGSKDSVEEFISKDKRIKLIRQPKNKGAGACRNIGIQNALGEFLMFLDSDDLLEKRCLEKRINFAFNYPFFGFYVFTTAFFDNNSKKIIDITPVHKFCNKNSEKIKDHFLNSKPIWYFTAAPFYKKKALIENKIMFDERILSGQDKDFMIKVLINALTFKLSNDSEPDVLCRIHSSKEQSLNLKYKHDFKNKAQFFIYHLENINQQILNSKKTSYITYYNKNLLQTFYYLYLSSDFNNKFYENNNFFGQKKIFYSIRKFIIKYLILFHFNKITGGSRIINQLLS